MVKVVITDEMIKNGNKCKTSSCPVALGLLALGFTEVTAGLAMIIVDFNTDHEQCIDTPINVYRWMGAFDIGKRMIPTEFELDLHLHVAA